MTRHLHEELNHLQSMIRKQAAMVEEMVRLAHRSLKQRCTGTAENVQSLEQELNRTEILIEEECLRILALQQPVATDLRLVTAALKINVDLERIGDLALNLAERSESLAKLQIVQIPGKLDEMVVHALRMVRDANRSFWEQDISLAEEVCRQDDVVDDLNNQLIHEVIEETEKSRENTAAYFHLFSASRIVERISDHATNIAEDVIYLVEGSIKRHLPTLEMDVSPAWKSQVH